MTFVIGADTMVRLIDPKYYGDDRDSMLDALADMRDLGAHFIVGGRVEQGVARNEIGAGGRKFTNGQEEVGSLPPEARGMFTLLGEDEFRSDVSSTEIRRRQMMLEEEGRERGSP